LKDEIKQCAPPIFAPIAVDPWVVSSLLQKSIRRGETEIAQRAALTLFKLKGSAIWRRLMVIAFESGNRVRVIGYDPLLQEDDYRGFPMAFFTHPGNAISMVNGHDVSANFSAFVHAPFKDDSAGARNETSLALRSYPKWPGYSGPRRRGQYG
jgi:hypothetical protein